MHLDEVLKVRKVFLVKLSSFLIWYMMRILRGRHGNSLSSLCACRIALAVAHHNLLITFCMSERSYGAVFMLAVADIQRS